VWGEFGFVLYRFKFIPTLKSETFEDFNVGLLGCNVVWTCRWLDIFTAVKTSDSTDLYKKTRQPSQPTGHDSLPNRLQTDIN
jgi:hypothetical protein